MRSIAGRSFLGSIHSSFIFSDFREFIDIRIVIREQGELVD